MGNIILCASHISSLKKTDSEYEDEKHKVESLEKICGNDRKEKPLHARGKLLGVHIGVYRPYYCL